MREIRLALVLYGGVSLAIYIYGVVYEFWRLVLASRGAEKNAYTELLQRADVWATVDIVSGASAGGINGVLLGKALATGGDLASVRSLWVDGGDFGRLLRSRSEREPPSLLRTDLFETLVEQGLAAMDRGGTREPLVDVLDFFAPGTRLRPARRQTVDELGQVITQREYRKIFKLKFRKRGYNEADRSLGYDRNDFRPEMNPALGQVIRATSAFPVAFEPKLIDREDDNDVLFEKSDPSSAWFSDGGILHNKPFTEALSTIFSRAAERPVRRWLLAVEPDPEHFVPPPGTDVYPEAPEVVSKALMGIPRYESIAVDLESLEAHRRRVERARGLLRTVDKLAAAVDPGDLVNDDKFDALLEDQLLYAAYRLLRRDALAAAFCENITEAVAFTRPRQVEAVRTGAADFVAGLSDAALNGVNPGYEVRRTYYLLDRFATVRADLGAEADKDLRPFQRKLWAEFDRIAQLVWEEFQNPDNPRAAALQALRERVDADLASAVTAALERAAPELHAGLGKIRTRTAATCNELDDELAARGTPTAVSFETIHRRYELWDMFILPVDLLADAGERDRVGFIRISPEAATYVRKSAGDKLAGDALGHFGGFARKEWRENDILWGRLDAAEVIARILMEGKKREDVESAIATVQGEVVRDELPELQGDYRSYLEKNHNVGSETIAVIPMADRATFLLDAASVARNMMRRLGNARLSRGLPQLFRGAGRLLSFALMLFRWPVLAIWGRDPAVRRTFTLVVVFLAGWAVLSSVLVLLFDVADVGGRFWTLVGIALAIFVVWGVLRTLADRGSRPQSLRDHAGLGKSGAQKKA